MFHSFEGKSLCYHLKVNANLFLLLFFPNLPGCLVAADSRLSVITKLFTEALKLHLVQSFPPLLDFPAAQRRLGRQKLCTVV